MPIPGKRLVPLRTRTAGANFRYLPETQKQTGGTKWASCESKKLNTGFKNDIFAPNTKGFFLTGGDLGLIGLGLSALLIPAAIAYHGVASAYFLVSEGTIITSQGIAEGLGSGLIGGLFSALIHPTEPKFANFKKPCTEDRNAAF
jgi:hypothetical protein